MCDGLMKPEGNTEVPVAAGSLKGEGGSCPFGKSSKEEVHELGLRPINALHFHGHSDWISNVHVTHSEPVRLSDSWKCCK